MLDDRSLARSQRLIVDVDGAGVNDNATLASHLHGFSRDHDNGAGSIMDHHHFTPNGSRPRRNLDEYAAGNDFELREAIQKLFGLLYVAETQTSKPGIWEKLKSAAVKPFVAALLAEAAKQVASGTAQAFLQITS